MRCIIPQNPAGFNKTFVNEEETFLKKGVFHKFSPFPLNPAPRCGIIHTVSTNAQMEESTPAPPCQRGRATG